MRWRGRRRRGGGEWRNKEKWEWYLSHPSSSHPAGFSASRCWKEGVKKDEDERWFKGESQDRAQGGLVPTERAQWVAETEACWIYKQSIYPARDPERLASAMVIYTGTQPSFTLHYIDILPLSVPLSLYPVIPCGLCLSVGPDAQLASSYDIWS